MLGKTAMVVAGLLIATGVAEAKVPRGLVGKVHFSSERIKDQDPQALATLFAKRKPAIDLTRQKDGHWKVTIVAFFRKAPVNGPITLWFYNKADKAALRAKEPVHVMSVNNSVPKEIFIHDLDVDPGFGFNKKNTYLIFVGQLIGKRETRYATGEVSLAE